MLRYADVGTDMRTNLFAYASALRHTDAETHRLIMNRDVRVRDKRP